MRIRKNAKNSAFLQTNPNLISYNHETNLCPLNQSPWDIITFPASSSHSFHQFDDFDPRYYVNLASSRSSVDFIEAIQSVASTKNSFECENDIVDDKIENSLECMKGDEEMCEDGLIDSKNDRVWASNKKARPVSRSRGTKKRAVAITPKQNEFYYYYGFGPSWSKKRGELGSKSTTFNKCDTIITNNSNVYDHTSGVDCDTGLEEEQNWVEPYMTMMKTSWSCEVGPKKEDLDYVDEEQDDKKDNVVKKRRKPIKARSLKSLM